MERELEEKFSELSKKIDDQFRFTRNVIALCTLTVIGVLIFTFTTAIDSLPTRGLLHYMSNLDKIVAEWKACETVLSHRNRPRSGSAPAAEEKDNSQ